MTAICAQILRFWNKILGCYAFPHVHSYVPDKLTEG